MTEEEEKEIREVFAFLWDNIGNSDQNKKYGIIFSKIQNINVIVLYEVLHPALSCRR